MGVKVCGGGGYVQLGENSVYGCVCVCGTWQHLCETVLRERWVSFLCVDWLHFFFHFSTDRGGGTPVIREWCQVYRFQQRIPCEKGDTSLG